MKRRARSRRAGFTLIELLIVSVITVIVLGTLALVATSGTRLFRTSIARTELEGRARRTLGRIQDELLAADHGSLSTFPQTPLWDEQLAFEQPMSFGAMDGIPEWRSTVIEFRHENGETDDGVDNDGDGLVDEGMVVLVRDSGGPNESTTVLCRGVAEYLEGEGTTPDGLDGNLNQLVDENGLCFELDGSSLVVRLTLQEVDTEGALAERTFETVIWLRN